MTAPLLPSPLETPSGKDAEDENFPVGLRFFPHYQTIKIFYRFARAIDDIADNAALAAADKIERLNRFEAALVDGKGDRLACHKAYALRQRCIEVGVSVQYGADLLTAFKQDAVKNRYQSWDELLEYCRYSANPVGRFLLDLHRESTDAYPASDALCAGLQILNHLQDCRADYCSLNRVYLPLEWIGPERVEDLGIPKVNAGLLQAIETCLERVTLLFEQASRLPGQLKSTSLALKSKITLSLARHLLTRLRNKNPIEHDVRLSKWDFASAGVKGVFRRQ